MSLMRTYDSGGRYQPRSYDFEKPSYHGYSDDYWSRRSEGYSSSYSSRLSEPSDENPFSPSTYHDKYSSYLDKYGKKDPEEPTIGTKYREDTRYGTNNNGDWKHGTKYEDDKFGSKDLEVLNYAMKDYEEPKYGSKYHEDKPYGTQYDGDVYYSQDSDPVKDISDYPSHEKYRVANGDYGGLYGDLSSDPSDTRDNGGEEDVTELMDRLSYKTREDLMHFKEDVIERQSPSDEVFAEPEMDVITKVKSERRNIPMRRGGYTKFVSVIPEENKYVSAVNYLPDLIEIRLVGAGPLHKPPPKWRSIPDLYNITLKPLPQVEERINYQETKMDYAFDDKLGILQYRSPKHEHLKEMYVTQYTHHFDPDEPRSHIAGWKVDIEPNGIPHEKSRMCVLKHPVVSGSRRRPTRPKSAPPKLYRFDSFDEIRATQRVDVAESLSSFPRDLEDYDYDDSSVGYAPSDDTSDSSAFVTGSPRRRRGSGKLGYNKPKLIRLGPDFPGIRNLEKMRRKKQSMGSRSSCRSLSSLPSENRRSLSSLPSEGRSVSSLYTPNANEDYGFYLALTSPSDKAEQSDERRAYSFSDH